MIEVTPLDCRFLPDGKNILVLRDYKVLYEDHLYVAPAGMLSDGASIPRWAWPIVGSPLYGKYREEAVMHDAFYRQEALVDGLHITLNPISRKDSDKVFLGMMATGEYQVELWRRQLIYWAVRVGGRSSWQGPKPAPNSWEW